MAAKKKRAPRKRPKRPTPVYRWTLADVPIGLRIGGLVVSVVVGAFTIWTSAVRMFDEFAQLSVAQVRTDERLMALDSIARDSSARIKILFAGHCQEAGIDIRLACPEAK